MQVHTNLNTSAIAFPPRCLPDKEDMRRLLTRLLKKKKCVQTQSHLRNLRDMVADWDGATLVWGGGGKVRMNTNITTAQHGRIVGTPPRIFSRAPQLLFVADCVAAQGSRRNLQIKEEKRLQKNHFQGSVGVIAHPLNSMKIACLFFPPAHLCLANISLLTGRLVGPSYAQLNLYRSLLASLYDPNSEGMRGGLFSFKDFDADGVKVTGRA